MNPDGQDPLSGAQGAQVNAEVSLIVLYSTCECVGGFVMVDFAQDLFWIWIFFSNCFGLLGILCGYVCFRLTVNFP